VEHGRALFLALASSLFAQQVDLCDPLHYRPTTRHLIHHGPSMAATTYFVAQNQIFRLESNGQWRRIISPIPNTPLVFNSLAALFDRASPFLNFSARQGRLWL